MHSFSSALRPGCANPTCLSREINASKSSVRLSHGQALASELLPPAAPELTYPIAGSKSKGKKAKTGRRGKKASRPRGGRDLREAGGDPVLRDALRLRRKLVLQGDLLRTDSFSILEDSPHISTGWHGLNPTATARKQVLALFRNPKKLQKVLETFRPVPADL